MRRGSARMVFLAALAVGASRPVPAVADRGVSVLTPGATAMGGAAVAVGGVDNALFFNPALLAFETSTHLRVLDVRVGVDENAFRQYRFFTDHRSGFEQLETLTDAERVRFFDGLLGLTSVPTRAGAGAMGPLVLVRPGLSVAVFAAGRTEYTVTGGASSMPVVEAKGTGDAAIQLGLGDSFTSFSGVEVAGGINMRLQYRVTASEQRPATALDAINDVVVYRGLVPSFDAGLLVKTGRVRLGAGLYDLTWPTFQWTIDGTAGDGRLEADRRLDGRARVGFAYYARAGVSGLLENVVIAGDLENIFSGDTSVLNKVSVGVRARVFGRIELGAGFHQGYPATGLSLDLGVVRMAWAYTGFSAGRFPGQLDGARHEAAVSLGWNG